MSHSRPRQFYLATPAPLDTRPRRCPASRQDPHVTDPTSLLHPPALDHRPDIRLIACDLDGTLLDDEHAIHDDFWPLVERLEAQGIVFCPASGRQYFNLAERFESIADKLVFIAENGSYVVRGGVELSSDCLSQETAHVAIRIARDLRARGGRSGAVLCGKRSAYIEWADTDFHAEVAKYYHRLERVDDLLAIEDDFLKVAVFDFESSERMVYPAFAGLRDGHQVVVSGKHWLDVMAPSASKGAALRQVQQAMNITREQTMAFGDFLNDLEMMDEAGYSFAMANAHAQLKARARFLAPGNADNGVVRTIVAVLGLGATDGKTA